MKQTYSFLLGTLCLLCSTQIFAANEEDSLYVNGLLSAPETSYLGDDTSILDGFYYKSYIDRGAFHLNHYWSEGGFGGGFTYSNCTDVTTPGFTNLSSYAGKGKNGDSYFISNANDFTPAEITFNDGYTHKPIGAYFTNATYAALSMLNGDGYAKKFGGESGTDEDWFLLTVTGYDATGMATGSTEIYLADYRSEDPAKDYIIKDWKWLDLSALGEVSKIGFSMTSSDTGDYGMNNPSYFCMDGLKVTIGTSTGVENTSLQESKAFYTDGQLYIQGLQGATAYLYSTGGTLVHTISVDDNAFTTPLQITAGTYLLKVIQGDSNKTFKIAVQ